MINETPRIETIIGTMRFNTESGLFEPYAPEGFSKYVFDKDFRGKFLYIPSTERDTFIALNGELQREGQEISEVEAHRIYHERIKGFLGRLNPETKELSPSAGGYCTIIPSRNFVAFFGTTVKYQKGIDEMRDGLVARALNQESGGLIYRVLPLKASIEANEIQEVHLDENGEPFVKLDFSRSVSRLKC